MKENGSLRNSSYLRSTAQEMQGLLLRVISGKETAQDKKNYHELQMALIRGLEPLDIPDFLFSCDSIEDFSKFIKTLSITEQGKVSYVEKTFAPIINRNIEEKSSVQLPRIASEVLNETRYVGRVAKGEDSTLVTNKLVKFSWQLNP